MKKLIIFGMLMLTTLFGQVRELTDENFDKAIKRGMVVVEFYASWNKANIVTLLDEWDNFEVNRVCRLDVEKYDKIMTSNNVVVLPTIIFYLDGEEAGRLQGNMKFQLETTTKELDKMVEKIYNEDKFN
tara:strand:+ start:74 stop:460 length:387 start_codon:yes stop_codon:yes gene_type:complete